MLIISFKTLGEGCCLGQEYEVEIITYGLDKFIKQGAPDLKTKNMSMECSITTGSSNPEQYPITQLMGLQ